MIPRSSDLSMMCLHNCHIKGEHRTRYPSGVIPKTAVDSTRGFEVFVQNDCLPAKGFRAQHFFVANDQSPYYEL